MPRTIGLFVAILVVAALGAAWFASRPSPIDDAPLLVQPKASAGADAPPVSRQRARDADVADAPPRTPKRTGRLIVRVVSREDDSPIAGARIEQPGDDGEPAIVTTDANGDATLDVPIDDGADRADAWFDVTAPGRVRDSVRATVPPGAEQRETVSLRRAFSVEGVVRDAAGRPIAGARIVAQETGFCMRPYPEVSSAESDAEGRFRVDGLPLNSGIRYEVAAPRHVFRAFSRRPHDAAPLDVRLEVGGTIRGVVRSPSGEPVAGARVTASCAAADSEAESRFEDEPVWTDEDGRFDVGSLPFGRSWTFSTSHSDFMESASSPATPVNAEHPEGTVDLQLRAVARIEVEFDAGPVHPPTKARLRSNGDGPEECAVPGRATFVVRSAGEWSMTAYAPGLRPGTAKCDVGPGETKQLRIRFEDGASIEGVVVDDTGGPVPGAVVTADKGTNTMQAAVAGPDGAFVVRGLEESSHEVLVEAPGHAECKAKDVVAPAVDARFVVERFGEAVLRLRLPDGAPVPTKRRIHWNDYPHVAEDDGPWTGGEIVRSLPPGDWLLEIEVDGYVPIERRDIKTLAGQRTVVDEIVLDPGLPLAGRLIDVEGRGVPHATVFVDLQILETDADGRFGLAHAAPGTRDIRAKFNPDFLDTEVPYVLAKDAPPLVVTLRRGAMLRVVLRGAPAGDLDVTAPRAEAAASGEDTGDLGRLEREEPGRYSARLPAGPTLLRVRNEAGATLATRNVDLREGDDVTVEVDLPK
jgi:hypothetical protein